MDSKQKVIAHAIWRAQAANSIGRDNATKRAQRTGMAIVARHIANEIPAVQRDEFLKATGLHLG